MRVLDTVKESRPDNECLSAQTKWRKLDGGNRMPEVIQGIEFKDGIKQLQNAAQSSPTNFWA